MLSCLRSTVFKKRGRDAPVPFGLEFAASLMASRNACGGSSFAEITQLFAAFACFLSFSRGKSVTIRYAGDNSGFGVLRREGFLRALEEAGIRDVPCPSLPRRNQFDTIHDMLSTRPGEPLAVFCYNDWRAHTLINLARMLGVECPRHVAFLGVDNDFNPQATSRVKISTVEPADYEIGRQAAALIVRMLRGAPAPAAPILIPPLRIIERESTDRYATDDPVLRRAIGYIDANAQRNISVRDIADAAGGAIALRTLQQRFRDAFGTTMIDALLHARVRRAKALLAAGDLSTKEIAYITGFPTPSHFSATFRRLEGMTPGTFRRRTLSGAR